MSRAREHPLGPYLYRVQALRPNRARLVAGLVLLAGVVVLAVAAWLEPDPAGYGTHRQLGISACGMMATTGVPCPTCGMTTAFSLAIRGRWIEAVKAQAAGTLLVVAVGLTCAVSCSVLLTGKVWLVNWFRVSAVKLVFLSLAILLAAWIVKIQLV
ncbi:MAG: DUF2752 domain-containing protein [Planctomycetes bacterium]|nr:DUF2752 domain-containing protein [Planctomycetota bacterium]